MVSINEKLEIAEELGLTHQVQWLQAKQELDSLVDLSMPPITEEGVKRLLLKNLRRHPRTHLRVFGIGAIQGIGAGGVLGCLLSLFALVIIHDTSRLILRMLSTMSLFIVGGGVLGYWKGNVNIEFQNQTLSNWKTELPYGALCAIKEAQTKGYTDLTVWYPSIRADDPVLTAKTPHGKQVLVFAWDEELLYREGGG